jgi:hypothetical protein
MSEVRKTYLGSNRRCRLYAACPIFVAVTLCFVKVCSQHRAASHVGYGSLATRVQPAACQPGRRGSGGRQGHVFLQFQRFAKRDQGRAPGAIIGAAEHHLDRRRRPAQRTIGAGGVKVLPAAFADDLRPAAVRRRRL